MNQKAIIAIENKKLLKNIKNNNLKLEYKKVQYREAIIEILEEIIRENLVDCYLLHIEKKF